jgi:adenine-specific DNA-methyltransferase
MSSEEAGREEKFFHETMDRADIDVLKDPKVLTGFERIDSDGVHAITDPSTVEFFDAEGNLAQNLLIKGNNLIALHSLRSRLAGKVKLIYIDPPYNTGNDGFRYNDRFNHSSWLVFMKNRLEIARELLREDGVIFISLDDNEAHYCKVLCDEVF